MFFSFILKKNKWEISLPKNQNGFDYLSIFNTKKINYVKIFYEQNVMKLSTLANI